MLDRLLSRMPSLLSTSLALAAGVGLAYLLDLFDGYARARGYFSSEKALWAFVNRMGVWWSVPLIAAALTGLYYSAQLDRPRTPLGFAARMLALTGFALYLGCWANTGLRPVAALCTVTSFALLVRQAAKASAMFRRRPSYRDEPWMTRLYAMLSTELDDLKKASAPRGVAK